MLTQDGWRYNLSDLIIKKENTPEVEEILEYIFSTDLLWEERIQEISNRVTKLLEIGETRLHKELAHFIKN